MDLLMLTYGRIVSAFDKEGAPYDDWRCAYLDWPGMIEIRVSPDEPDKKAVWLYPYAPEASEQPYFHTSFGEAAKEDEKITIKTANSFYVFEENEDCLTEDEKSSLFYGICDILETGKNNSGE